MSAVTTIEAVWTFIAFLGLLTQLWAVSDTLGDWRALEQLGVSNGRRILVRGHIRAATVFCIIHTFFALAGVVALLQPNTPLTPGRVFTIVMLLMAAAALVANGLLDRRDRRRVRG